MVRVNVELYAETVVELNQDDIDDAMEDETTIEELAVCLAKREVYEQSLLRALRVTVLDLD